MSRLILALTLAAPLMLDGSLTHAATAASQCTTVCALPLAMMTPPPRRPADLMARHTAPVAPAAVVPVAMTD